MKIKAIISFQFNSRGDYEETADRRTGTAQVYA